MPPPPHAVLERFFPAMFARDAEVLADLFHSDASWHLPPFAAEHIEAPEGRDALVQFLCSAGGELFRSGSASLEVEVQAVEGDRAVVIGWMRAITAKGAPYANRYAFGFRFEGGRIREVWELLDSLHFQRQQEASAAPGPA